MQATRRTQVRKLEECRRGGQGVTALPATVGLQPLLPAKGGPDAAMVILRGWELRWEGVGGMVVGGATAATRSSSPPSQQSTHPPNPTFLCLPPPESLPVVSCAVCKRRTSSESIVSKPFAHIDVEPYRRLIFNSRK